MAGKQCDKYVMSLDAVDINYLLRNFQSKYNVTPLWGSSNVQNENYYEFHIRNVDKIDDEDEMETTTCYMCNIEVPKAYLKAHLDSFKHKINLKIAEAAIDRLKKNMKNTTNYDDLMNDSKHFCPVCVTVVKIKDKIGHEKSIAHKNSVIIDKFLNDFYDLYTDNDSSADNNGEEIPDLTNCQVASPVNSNLSDIEFISAKSKLESAESGSRNENRNTVNGNYVDLDIDDFKVVEKLKNKQAQIVDEDIVETTEISKIDDKNEQLTFEIVTDNNNDGKVSKKKKKKLKSKLKDNVMLSVESAQNCELTEELSRILGKYWKDPTIVDMRDDPTKATSKNSSAKTKTKQLATKLDANEIDKKTKIQKSDTCEICDNENSEHTRCDYLMDVLSASPPESLDIIKKIQHHLVIKAGVPFCMVCKMLCLGVDVITHLLSDQHFDRYERLLEENFLLKVDERFKCQTCGILLDVGNELTHCEDMAHITEHEIFMRKLRKKR